MEDNTVPTIGDPLLVSTVGSADAELEELYREQRTRLTHLAAAITLDRAVAEEVVQDAFVALRSRLTNVREPLAYLHRSVVHGSIGVIRRRRTAARFPVPVATPSVNPEIDETWAVVVALPPRERAVVVLRFWQDMTEAEIAATMQWPIGTVKSTLHRALKRLRKELSDDHRD